MSVEQFELTPGYHISRVIKGGWHLAGGHGQIDDRTALADMRRFVEAGITTFDCADIYTGVETLIGKFLSENREDIRHGNLPKVQIHTKYVPDRDQLSKVQKSDTVSIIDRSLKRLGVDQLDLVQFAWWDYDYPNYVEVAMHLMELKKAGKIRHIGVTNFDTKMIREMVEAGVEIAANQVQYSVIDRRVEEDQPSDYYALKIPFLCYGTVSGGFFSEQYLNQPEPKEPYENRSLTKYKLIIDEFGNWDLFQELLKLLKTIGDKYNKGIGEVASRYILQKELVGAVIIGARNSNHLSKMKSLFEFELDAEDLSQIKTITDLGNGPNGPFYELERDKNGKHGKIMKYNLNSQDGS